jgi:hypothetical protein
VLVKQWKNYYQVGEVASSEENPSDSLKSKTQLASLFKGDEPAVHQNRSVRALECLDNLCYVAIKH